MNLNQFQMLYQNNNWDIHREKINQLNSQVRLSQPVTQTFNQQFLQSNLFDFGQTAYQPVPQYQTEQINYLEQIQRIPQSYSQFNTNQQLTEYVKQTEINPSQLQNPQLIVFNDITYQQQTEARQQNIKQKKVRQTYKRALSQQFTEFQNSFAQSMKQVLREQSLLHVDLEIHTEQELCACVNNHLKESGQKQFWKRMNELIPSKNIKQLREYYQKSFQRVLYENQIDYADKEVQRELIRKHQTESPTEIAGRFMQVCAQKNYFKRNIVMYIINLKRK
ncbi:Hypothetical_protein [Hexamita inflata]|uniref:Hypothetical_protein n=1 Tax=Hexamita inflata TaxID=28002 RepID=A0AA86Q0H1_9EUKA|nr:Hypothetical protein HINF_LOCUS37459 [Hexamita inflata]